MTTKLQERQSFDSYSAVVKALEPYLQGARLGDLAMIRSTFADHANISGIYGGNLSAGTADGITEWPAQPSPDVQAHIAAIDISGTAAYAKLEIIDWMGMRFTDMLLLIQIGDEWKICAKLSDSHSASAPAE